MTSSPPDPDSSRDSRRRNEEPIAVIVALLSMGGIFFWSVNQQQAGFDLFSLGKPAATVSPTIVPTVSPTIAPSASVTAPSAIASPTAGTGTNGLSIPPASPSVDPARPVPLVLPGATVQPEASGAASVPAPTPTPTQTVGVRFSDVAPDYWASPFIVALSQRGIIRGFEDSTFLPNKPVTRAEFAAMLQKAFEDQPKLRQSLDFKDLPATYWARSAIDETFQTGFLNGYPDNVFLPNQEIPKVQALTALANGLKLKNAGASSEVLKAYQDTAQIPPYAVDKVAAATEAGMVVNYPDRGKLNPNQAITRADAAALIYQALVSAGKAEKIPSNYIVPRQG